MCCVAPPLLCFSVFSAFNETQTDLRTKSHACFEYFINLGASSKWSRSSEWTAFISFYRPLSFTNGMFLLSCHRQGKRKGERAHKCQAASLG